MLEVVSVVLAQIFREHQDSVAVVVAPLVDDEEYGAAVDEL